MRSLDYLDKNNILYNQIYLDEIPKSAKDVGRLFGCPVQQVLKTIVLIGNQPIIAIIQGDQKISFQKIKDIYNFNSLRMANPSEVEKITGYTIGKVSPFGIEKNVKKIINESVFKLKTVNIGSGSAEIGIELDSKELKKVWDGNIGVCKIFCVNG